MGFMADGSTLSWSEAKRVAAYIKAHGIEQFINVWQSKRRLSAQALLWGDEIEYVLVSYDHAHKRVRLNLSGHDVLQPLHAPELADAASAPSLWRPEYGSFMIEGTPGQPYCGNPMLFVRQVEANMLARRLFAEQQLPRDTHALTLVNFPLNGMGHYTLSSTAQPRGPVAQSLFTPDDVINHHLRFSTLTRNIRERRGSRVDIRVPLFRDTHTAAYPVHPDKHETEIAGQQSPHWPEPHTIYMDSMAFGMGMCCLQVTFQCVDIDEARALYDQLAVVAPIFLALSANAPIFRGFLADQDVRWNVISASVDDRTPLERTPPAARDAAAPGAADVPYLAKSRYASVSRYIGQTSAFQARYNDLDTAFDSASFERLRAAGLDERLARHLAHYFTRDPLVMYHNRIELDDTTATDHFENIQSTNWQTVRFKPPPPASPIGWRVEFRPLEVQLTDFENAAFATVIVLLTRVLMAFDLNLYLPLSLVDENMRRAHTRDAVNAQKFWFRTRCTRASCVSYANDWAEMTIDEIFNGHGDDSSMEDDGGCDPARPGLLTLVSIYLDTIGCSGEEREHMDRYIQLLSQRAAGTLINGAEWQRRFVRSHPAYKNDSIVSQEIAYDLCMAADRLAHGQLDAPELLGVGLRTPPLTPKSSAC
jgi:glutamate--cysteine ligase catalytic subunit